MALEVKKQLEFQANSKNQRQKSTQQVPPTSLTSRCGVPMKNGQVSGRACDLEELCKDWVFIRRKIYEYNAQDNETKTEEVRRSFQKTNVKLSAYDDKLVADCLNKSGG